MDELCMIGNILWEESSEENFNEKKYKKYVEHIKKCSVCWEGLEMSKHDMEILNEFS